MRATVSEALITKSDAFHRWGGRVPILLGAAGHRRIDARLADTMKDECVRLRKRYRHSPFVVLSSLAEGADRLIARVAMQELSAELIAVLPMPQRDFERDFQTEESKAEFRAFLSRALFVKEAPVPEGDASWTVEGEPRNRQYARAGAIVADHVQVLFAIWDGKPARGTGGTGDQVAWFARGGTPNSYSPYMDAMSLLDLVEPGLLIRIDPVSRVVSHTGCPSSHTGKGGGPIWQILTRTDKYNRDVLRNKSSIARSAPLVPKTTRKTDKLTVTDLTYRASDNLSAYFARSVRNADAIIYALALAAVAVFNFVSNKVEAPWIYLGITFVMAILAGSIWFQSIDNRFLEYRCIAEAARTLFFWRCAGVKHPLWIIFLSRQLGRIACLSGQLGPMHWVRQAVRSVEFCQDCGPQTMRPTSGGLDIARTYWINDQKAWLERKQLWHLRRYKFWNRVSQLALGASFLTAIILALLTVIPAGNGSSLWKALVKAGDYGDLWQAALGVFAGGGVAARGFLARRSHLELAKQYASQRFIFESAIGVLDHPKPEWTAEQILEKLGREVLQEQAEWLWLRHTRPFEMPTT